MPTIKAYLSQDLFEKLGPSKRQELGDMWREIVSQARAKSVEDVVVFWFPYADAQNPLPIELVVTDSVTDFERGELEMEIEGTECSFREMGLALRKYTAGSLHMKVGVNTETPGHSHFTMTGMNSHT